MPWLTAPQLTFGDDSGEGRGGLSAISDIATARFFSPDLDTSPEAAVIRWNSTAQQSGGCSFLLDPCRGSDQHLCSRMTKAALAPWRSWLFNALLHFSTYRCSGIDASWLWFLTGCCLVIRTHDHEDAFGGGGWSFSKLTFAGRNVIVVFPSTHTCTRILPRPQFYNLTAKVERWMMQEFVD